MKHFFRTLFLLCSVSSFTACDREGSPGPVKVTFAIEAPAETTRVPGSDPAAEQAALHWTLLLFRDGELADYGICSSTGTITRELERGSYTAWAVVNCPEERFRPESVRTEQELEETAFDIGDNRLPGLLMAGRETLRIPAAHAPSRWTGSSSRPGSGKSPSGWRIRSSPPVPSS